MKHFPSFLTFTPQHSLMRETGFLLTCPQEAYGRKAVELRCEPRTNSHPKFCFLSSTQLTCTQAGKRRFISTKTRCGGSPVYHLGGKLPSPMKHFYVKFGAEGCRALIPGGLVSQLYTERVRESQLYRKEKSKPMSRHHMPSRCNSWKDDLHAVSGHGDTAICDASQIKSHFQWLNEHSAPISTPTYATAPPQAVLVVSALLLGFPGMSQDSATEGIKPEIAVERGPVLAGFHSDQVSVPVHTL